jgi:tRNA-dihydrouridine synthase A
MLNPKHFSVAPMMDYTDKHDRYFLRLIAPDVLLYTEMITAHALRHGDADYLLAYHAAEHPLALQLGGSDPDMLVDAAKLGEKFAYDEINLNVGCPSPRVSSGRFGACLMREPSLVAECVSAMRSAVSVPVTVKCRIGVDEHDSYELLCQFIRVIAAAGCNTFIVHARKAWLSGLSPKENRDIPPLRYDVVRQIKQDFPELTVILNGGIKTLSDIENELPYVDGVMIGRAAYSNPYFLAEIQAKYFSHRLVLSRDEIACQMIHYVAEEMSNGTKLSAISRHILGLYTGQRGAAAWRRYISEHSHKAGAGIEVIERALNLVSNCTKIV